MICLISYHKTRFCLLLLIHTLLVYLSTHHTFPGVSIQAYFLHGHSFQCGFPRCCTDLHNPIPLVRSNRCSNLVFHRGNGFVNCPAQLLWVGSSKLCSGSITYKTDGVSPTLKYCAQDSFFTTSFICFPKAP
jgi:hypothetical protein